MSPKPQITKEYLQEEYVNKQRSTVEIARTLHTYSNRIRRALLVHNIALRDKSEAQTIVLETGKAAHPTKGKKHSVETKEKLSEKLSKSWDNLSKAELTSRSERAKLQWAKLSDCERKAFQKSGARAVARTAREGSRLEKYLLFQLRLTYPHVPIEFHKNVQLSSHESMSVDIVFNNIVCIEVDGPSHIRPIWGDEVLEKHQNRDRTKNGLLVNAGYKVIRLRCGVVNLSHKHEKEAFIKLIKAMDKILNTNITLEELEIK